MNETTLNNITYGLTAFVVLAFLWAVIYFFVQKKNDKLIEKRRWIENLPSFISSLGVLGTFAGITLGLINFNPDNLDESIPLLLSGLKTAFFTSLTGMIGSMILSKLISSAYDNKDKGVSDINLAAGLITQSVSKMEKSSDKKLGEISNKFGELSKAQDGYFSSLFKYLEEQNKATYKLDSTLATLAIAIAAMKSNSDETKELLDEKLETLNKKFSAFSDNYSGVTTTRNQQLEGISEKLDGINSAVDSRLESITISVGNVEEGVATQTQVVKSVDENVAEIVEAATGTYNTQSDIVDEIKKLSPVIRDEVTEIEEKMNETNALLTAKFDEFSELLKKSNTEALVEVMKGVTLEFEKQMSALINKLIQENFEQLNQSVANMNQWQQENKAMIVSLTSQYKQMSSDFEETSTTLQKVGDNTKLLVSDGGKLHQIIQGLEQVMAKDKDFVTTANSLRKAAEINEQNMAEYQEYTRNLNVWVQKQRDFVEGVKSLIKKLEELDKLRDFNNDFWAETKKNLQEAQGLMQNGAFFLRKELEGLDQHFYNRLSETLAQLDACIQAMITEKRR